MRRLIYLLMPMMLSGCINFDDELTIEKTPFNGDNLKTNGYYYNIWKVNEETFVEINFLYRDGVLLHGGSRDSTSFSKLEEVYLDSKFYGDAIKRKYYWGSFIVEGDSIFIERWYPSSRPYFAYRQSGIILNDSTYRLIKIVRVDNTEEGDIDRIFHFKQFSPKPDSTNNFIK